MRKSLALAAFALTAAAIMAWRCRARPALSPRAFVAGIPEMRPDMRLVVSRLDFTETIAAESPKVAWGVDWGTTKAVLSVPVRVHYALDLSGPEPVEFRFDANRRTLIAVFPDPEVQAVEIFSGGKRTAVEPGWGRLEALSGRALLDRLDRGVYDAVKAQAASPGALARTKDEARPALARLLAAYLARAGIRPGSVAVRFRSDENAVAAPSPDGPRISYTLRKIHGDDMPDTYLTRAGYDKLKKDLVGLMKQKAQTSLDIGEAREKGDLKENAEYHSAKEKLGELMGRIGTIQDKLQTAKIIDEMDIPKDTVAIGTTVSLEDSDGDHVEYALVGEDESDPSEGKISVQSPLAQGLLGKKVQQTAEVVLPNGTRTFKILKVARTA